MTERAPSPADVGHVYMTLHHRVHRLVDDAMNTGGLSLARTKVLQQLRDCGPMKQAAIAGNLSLAPRSVTEAIDALARDGLAERSPDPTDRRAWLVGITEEGIAVLASALRIKKKAMDEVFGSLSPAERTQLVDLLTTVTNRLVAVPGECSAKAQ